MADALFLSLTYLQNNTPLNANIDASELYPHAKTAEDIHIQEVIGTKLYDYLKGIVIASKASPPVSISTNDRTLLEHLRNALIWYTVYDAFPFIGTKIRNIGIVQQNGDNLTNATDAKENKLEDKILNKAVAYMNIVKRYLCEYDDLYSEFKCDSWNLNPNLLTATNSGIAFERRTREDIDYNYVKKWFNS
jgi:hypothetical protein